MSAGWVWHPFDMVKTFDLAEALRDPTLLDASTKPLEASYEVNCAAFQTDDRVIACNCDEESESDDDEPFRAGSLGIFSRQKKIWESVVTPADVPGEMMPLGERFVVGFFENPKLIDLRSGEVVHVWTNLETGRQTSSIIHHLERLPPLALDVEGKRFAVADDSGIHIVSFKGV